MSVLDVFAGWKNVAWKSPAIEKMALERGAVCAECEFRKGDRCGACGCFIIAKVRAPRVRCPKSKW